MKFTTYTHKFIWLFFTEKLGLNIDIYISVHILIQQIIIFGTGMSVDIKTRILVNLTYT